MVLEKIKKDFLLNPDNEYLWFATHRAEIESVIPYITKKRKNTEIIKKFCKVNWYIPYFLYRYHHTIQKPYVVQALASAFWKIY